MAKKWTIEYDPTTDEIIVRGMNGIICEIPSIVDKLYGGVSDLIRTAPEMLEALKEVHQSYGKLHSKYIAREKVGRVIAKAEGRDYEAEKPPHETQAQREARLSKDHNYEDCELAVRGVCWICEERGRERAEESAEIAAKGRR